MDDFAYIHTERECILIRYIIAELQRERWVVLHGEKSSGKTVLAYGIAERFPGRTIILNPINTNGYRWDWTLVYDNQPNNNLVGCIFPVTSLWSELCSTVITNTAESLLIILENAHGIKHGLAEFIQQGKAQIPGVHILTVGMFTSRQRRKLHYRHPSWVTIPAPGIDEARQVIAHHAGIDLTAINQLPSHFIRRIMRSTRGERRLLARAGWCIRQALQAEDIDVGRFSRKQRKWVLRCLPTPRRRVLTASALILIAGTCWFAGWKNGALLSPLLPELPRNIFANRTGILPKSVDLGDKIMTVNDATQLLFEVWGYETDKKEAWCDQAWRGDLICESGVTTLDQLKNQGLPWIAQLQVADKKIPVVVIGFRGENVIALAGKRTWHLRLAWFSTVWNGNYTIMRKTTPEGKTSITKKSSVEDIIWLDAMLSRVLNVEADESGEWSALLVEKIRQFQVQNGLTADGIAGQLSLIKLWQALDESPKLIVEGEGH